MMLQAFMALNIKYDIGEYGAHIQGGKTPQRPKQSNNVTFDADPDIYMAKKMKSL